MTDKEMLKISVEEFSRIQDWMELADKESEIYKSLKKRYTDLKVILTASGINPKKDDEKEQPQYHLFKKITRENKNELEIVHFPNIQIDFDELFHLE